MAERKVGIIYEVLFDVLFRKGCGNVKKVCLVSFYFDGADVVKGFVLNIYCCLFAF